MSLFFLLFALLEGRAHAQNAALAACALGNYEGLDRADARSVATLVCQELHRQGVAAGTLAEASDKPAARTFRVHLLKLGQKVILELDEEGASGVAVDSRKMELNAIEESSVAAPRLVNALLKKQSIQQTQDVTNVTGSETRQYRSMPSQTLFGLGLGGSLFANSGTPFAFGAELRLEHQAPRYGFGGFFRVTGGENDTRLISLNIGAKYFLTLDNVAPFLGAGLQIMTLGYEAKPDESDYSRGGLGAYTEVGVEFMRFHDSRLGLLLRLDLPFFVATRESSRVEYSRYVLPIGLFVYYMF